MSLISSDKMVETTWLAHPAYGTTSVQLWTGFGGMSSTKADKKSTTQWALVWTCSTAAEGGQDRIRTTSTKPPCFRFGGKRFSVMIAITTGRSFGGTDSRNLSNSRTWGSVRNSRSLASSSFLFLALTIARIRPTSLSPDNRRKTWA